MKASPLLFKMNEWRIEHQFVGFRYASVAILCRCETCLHFTMLASVFTTYYSTVSLEREEQCCQHTSRARVASLRCRSFRYRYGNLRDGRRNSFLSLMLVRLFRTFIQPLLLVRARVVHQRQGYTIKPRRTNSSEVVSAWVAYSIYFSTSSKSTFKFTMSYTVFAITIPPYTHARFNWCRKNALTEQFSITIHMKVLF